MLKYRVNLFHEIHEIVFHGRGGYDWHTVYSMPIWLRKVTFQKMKEWFDKEREAAKPKKGNKIDMVNPDKSKLPDKRTISPPSYITKASKK
tara:strand:- start:423 stop:695 length:273 start_codon:yes stop_codon:yes gene_type:complete